MSKNIKLKFDWKLVLFILSLIMVGIFIEFVKFKIDLTGNINKYVNIIHKILYIIFAIILGVIVYFFDYRKIKKYSLIIYIIASIIMVLPIIPEMCFNIDGVLFYKIKGISIPITAVAMPLYIISFVGFLLNNKKDDIKVVKINIKKLKIQTTIRIRKKLVKDTSLAIISLLLMLIDMSFTNMIILSISYIVMSIIKVRRDKDDKIFKLGTLYIFVLALICICTTLIFIQQSINWDEYSEFINAKVEYSTENSDMVLQREILRKSKLIGEAENLSVPIDQTVFKTESNYTFIYIIGKFGLLMGELIVLIIVFISLRIIFNAKKITELYGRYLTIGLGSVYILQSFVTMFINISLGIYADVNIPFVTYGRVHFIINMFEIALLLSIYRRKDIYNLENENNIVVEKIVIQK